MHKKKGMRDFHISAYPFLATVLLSLIPNVHNSCISPLHKVYLIILRVVIHYTVRYYTVIPSK